MWTDFTANFLFRGASRSSTVGRKNILSIGRATMLSISRILIELSRSSSIRSDKRDSETSYRNSASIIGVLRLADCRMTPSEQKSMSQFLGCFLPIFDLEAMHCKELNRLLVVGI